MKSSGSLQQFFEELTSFIDSRKELISPPPSFSLEEELLQWAESSSYPSHCFTPILRGLPRLFLQTDLSQSTIKKPFSDRNTLIRHWLHRPLLTLYASSSLCTPIKISILTWVISDGWGDLFAQLEAAHLIHTHFPQLQLTLFTLIHKDRTPPEYDNPFEQEVILYSGELNGPMTHTPFSSEQLKILSDTDLLIEMPTAFPHIDQLLRCVGLNESQQARAATQEGRSIASPTPTPLHIRLGEHSMIDAVPYHPATSAWSMGLHFLEKGIFIKTLPEVAGDVPLRNRDLHNLLFSPFKNVESYRRHRSFQLAYTKNYRGLYLYLTALLSSLSEDDRDVDICFFQAPILAQLLNQQFRDPVSQELPLFKAWNVKEFHLYCSPYHTKVPIASSGKLVRFIHCVSIAHEDQLLLTSLTDHLIGVTGDQSVLEAMSTGRPFFYDPPCFKRPFLADLCQIAEKKLSEFPQLSQFFKLCLKTTSLHLDDDQAGWVSEECVEATKAFLSLEEDNDLAIGKALGNLLRDPLLSLAFQALRQYLADHYSITPILSGLISRTALFKKYPILAFQEERELEKLFQGVQTLDETLTHINRHIDEKN